jgi:hypothetical protein
MPKKNQPGCPCCGGGCGNCGCNCGPCLIPPGNLDVFISSPDIGEIQATTLGPATDGCTWVQSECENWGVGFFAANFHFSCKNGVFSFFGQMFAEGSCNGDRSVFFQWATECPAPNPGNPCALWTLVNGPCGDSSGIVFNAGGNVNLIFRSANPTGSYTRPASPVMCATVCAYLCNAVPSLAIPGAMVTISKGGTTVAAGTTGTDGCIQLAWTGKPGPYQVDVSADDFSSFSGIVKLTCGQRIFAPLLLTRDLSLAINSDRCVTSTTLRYDAPSNTWTSPCVPCGDLSVVYQISCHNGYLYFTWTFYDTGDCSGPGATFGWNGNGSPFTSQGVSGTLTLVPLLIVVTATGLGPNPTTYTIS